MANVTGWGRGTWGEGAWSEEAPVLVTGLSATSSVGSVTVTGSALVAEDSVTGTAAVGDVTSDTFQVVRPTAVTGTGEVTAPSIVGDANFSITGVAGTSAVGTVDAKSVVELSSGVTAQGFVSDVLAFTAQADAQVSTDQSKFGGSSLKLDGSGDRIQSADITLGTDDYTWETFAYFNNFSSSQCIWDAGENVGSSQNPVLYITSTNLQLSYAGGTFINQPHGMSANGWHHIAIVRDSNQLEAFIDGVSIGTATYTGGSGATNHVLGGNFAGTFTMDGFLDESRLTKRVIYTANFTPPTQAFTGTFDDEWLLHYDSGDGDTLIVNSAPGDVNITVTGTATISPTGDAGTGEIGTPTLIHGPVVIPTGEEATGSLGTLSMTGDGNITPTTVAGSGAVSASSIITGDANFSVTGQAGTGSVGSVTPAAGAIVVPTGQTATGRTGDPTVSAGATFSVTGVSGTGAVSTPIVWSKISPNVNQTWSEVAA
jgi:hypothetical protein